MCYPMSVSVYGTFILNFSVDFVKVDVSDVNVLQVSS